ncbi:MAG: aminotransferase, partial [Treponema sp.]|nr:aminotransferase [Treponema sp.]
THKSDALYALPFNSGYFMSFHLNSIDAEVLRKKLLGERGIGTISIDSCTLRIAFSSLDDDKIETVYSAIYETADELSRA